MLLGGYFEVTDKKDKLISLKEESLKDNFWDDSDKAGEIFKKINTYQKIIDEYEELIIMYELLKDDYNEDDFFNLQEKVKTLEIKTILNNEYDNNNCYLEVRPGAGGTESCDWASMLVDMYKSFCEKNDYKLEVISITNGDEAGIKNALIKISGEYAFGYLKNESGVHRLVRISPFDSNKRRHTSFASVSITPEIESNINIEIKDEDIKTDVYHSSGAGGQSVNTTNSAVRITHLPSKIVVTCQNERSQLKNKDVAMKILKSKLYNLERQKQEDLEKSLKDNSSINFGSQIRSYFLEPYKLVKDHRTNYESSDPLKILNGFIKELLEFNLRNLR